MSVLEKPEGVAAGTVSFLALQAPPAAQKRKQQARQKLEKQDAQGARKDLERALKLYENDQEALVGLGLACARQGDARGARAFFEKASTLDRQFTPPQVELARLALEEKNWPVAVQHCETALARNPLDLPLAHLFLAMARLNQGDYSGAETAARMAISANGPPKARHVLGVALVKLGQEAELVRRQLLALRAK
jgi:tetratricopeptide (TPR) repeat protein